MGAVLTNSGVAILLNRAFKTTPDYSIPDQLRVGEAQAEPVVTDTGLTLPIPLSGTEAIDACDATTGWSGSTDASSITTNTTSFKEGTASLNMGKSGTSSASVSYSKTVTGLDFTSKTLFGWVYIDDPADLISSGTALSVRYGSDNSNYYQKDYDITDLDDGWNLISFTSSTVDSTTGTPVLTAMDYLAVVFYVDNASDTITHADLRMDDWKLGEDTDMVKTVDSITINETSRLVTIEATVLATEANGFNITGFEFRNDDSSPLNLCIAKVTTVSKTNTEELTAVQKIRYRRTTGG